jgi:hypothetical protein
MLIAAFIAELIAKAMPWDLSIVFYTERNKTKFFLAEEYPMSSSHEIFTESVLKPFPIS